MEFLAELHTKIIHFPIAFLMLYPIFEFLFLITKKDFYIKSAFIFLLIGVIGSFFAVLSGNQAFESVKNLVLNKEIFYQHQLYANITVWFSTILLASRYFLYVKRKLNIKIIFVFLILSILGSYFVYQTGNYGGKFTKYIQSELNKSDNNKK